MSDGQLTHNTDGHPLGGDLGRGVGCIRRGDGIGARPAGVWGEDVGGDAVFVVERPPHGAVCVSRRNGCDRCAGRQFECAGARVVCAAVAAVRDALSDVGSLSVCVGGGVGVAVAGAAGVCV